VLTGRHASLDALARVVYAARREGAESVAVYDYRGALPDTGASTVERLAGAPLAAAERIVAGLEGRPAAGRRALRAVHG
jgi:MerR family transcriptional regulator, light-induced transcriptional regulator